MDITYFILHTAKIEIQGFEDRLAEFKATLPKDCEPESWQTSLVEGKEKHIAKFRKAYDDLYQIDCAGDNGEYTDGELLDALEVVASYLV